MSLINAIANCRNPIGSGISRKVFYSKKYNVVIKRQKYDPTYWGDQSRQECHIFDILDESDKDVIPMLGYIELSNGEVIGLWKLAKQLNKALRESKEFEDVYFGAWWEEFPATCRENFKTIVKGLNLVDNIDKMMATIEKYGLEDIDAKNLGIIDNHLVFLDLGYQDC